MNKFWLSWGRDKYYTCLSCNNECDKLFPCSIWPYNVCKNCYDNLTKIVGTELIIAPGIMPGTIIFVDKNLTPVGAITNISEENKMTHEPWCASQQAVGGQGLEDIPCDCHPDIKKRNGSPIFYKLLEKMADIHDRKSHDYASNSNPFANYHFAGMLSKLFDNPDDSGFVGRIGEKIFRLANLENNGKIPSNESIEDTEEDICTITVLWMADRRERRNKKNETSSR